MCRKLFTSIIFSILYLNVQSQDCVSNKECVVKLLVEKKNGWKFIEDKQRLAYEDKKKLSGFYFFYSKSNELEIRKEGTPDSGPTLKTNYHVIRMTNGTFGVRIDSFNADVFNTVRGFVYTTELSSVDFAIRNEGNYLILKPTTMKNTTIEYFFK